MSWLIVACGVLLAIAGGYSIVSGAPYMQIEFGWTEVIAGTTALAGGMVTIALGLVSYRLGALHQMLARTGAAASALQVAVSSPASSVPDLVAAPIMPGPIAPDPPPPPEAPSRPAILSGLRGRFGAGRKIPEAPMAPPLVATPSPFSADRAPEVVAPNEAVGPSEAVDGDQSPPPPLEAPFRRVGIEDAGRRDVVGRYQAGGASYVLFSDGTIEVETATGTHRFASMEELKAFVEGQDAEKADLGL